METEPNYLRERFSDDKEELRRSLAMISEVMPLFGEHFGKRIDGGVGWPYRIQEDQPEEELAQVFSSSTNAMIAFAMLGVAGSLSNSVLLPLSRPVPTQKTFSDNELLKRILKNTDRVLGRLTEPLQINSSPKPKSKLSEKPTFVFQSGTFGDDDPFTATWLLEAYLARAGSFPKDDLRQGASKEVAKYAKGVAKRISKYEPGKVLNYAKTPEKTKRPIKGVDSIPHPFPLSRVALLNRALDRLSPKKASTDLRAMREFFEERLHVQLAANTIPDSAFDAAELVFSLEGILLTEGLVDERRLETIFKVIADSQERNAYWRPLRPFVATQQGFALLPLSIEIATSLLRICRHLEKQFPERSFFEENLPLFSRYAQWLGSRRVHIKNQKAEFWGWHSEHIPTTAAIDLWETSQVLLFLLLYSDLLQSHIARCALKAVGLSGTSSPVPKENPLEIWGKALIEKEPLAGGALGSVPQVFERIKTRYVKPRSQNPLHPDETAKYSMLLYGPPGTGKTGIAEDLALALGQPLITITPSDFLAGGPSSVESRAKQIFQALEEQSNSVVLFDEIDRLILDRDSRLYREQGDAFQFMTPSMLVKLKNLREKKEVIFIIATNYYERIDSAARRTGRIDDRFLILPPDFIQRQEIINKLVKKHIRKKYINNHIGKANADEDRVVISAEKRAEDISAKLLASNNATFKAVLIRTALFSFGELKTLVEAAFEELGESDNATAIVKALRNASMNADPVIRIANYSERFKVEAGTGDRGERLATAQEPFEEFLGILALLEQVDRHQEAGLRGVEILNNIKTNYCDRADLKREVERLIPKLKPHTQDA